MNHDMRKNLGMSQDKTGLQLCCPPLMANAADLEHTTELSSPPNVQTVLDSKPVALPVSIHS